MPDLAGFIEVEIMVSERVWEPVYEDLSPYVPGALFPPPSEDAFYARVLDLRSDPGYADVLKWIVEYS
jgi:hypothetical protein